MISGGKQAIKLQKLQDYSYILFKYSKIHIRGEKDQKKKKKRKTHIDINSDQFHKLRTQQDGDVPASFGLYNFFMSMYSSYNKKKNLTFSLKI